MKEWEIMIFVKHNKLKKMSLTILLIFLFAGCAFVKDTPNVNADLINESSIVKTEIVQTENQTTPVPEVVMTTTLLETSETETSFSVVRTPTPVSTRFPIIEEVSGCEDKSTGHILFLTNEENKRLFVMNGNGCNAYQIMEDVSGSPGWSVDGQRIAVGCENDQMICILDAQKTLASCQEGVSGATCKAVIQQQISLPEGSGEKSIYNLSWSYDGKRLLMEYAELPDEKNTYILHLEDTIYWELMFESMDTKADYSPVEDYIAINGIREINLEEKYIIGRMFGHDPQWSPDGKYIAFLFFEYDERLEPRKMVAMPKEFDGGEWLQLYDHRPLDVEDWRRRNIIYSDNEYRLLSWSPDSKYIAFVGDYRYEGDSQIFRLDVETGEIFVLTTKLDSVYGEMQYIAPAWGP